MTDCLHCGATTSNGLVLCDLSQMKAAKALEFVPVYFRNLSRWRPGRAGARPVPGSRVLYDGETRTGSPDRVHRALEQASNDVTRLAERLAEERGLTLPDHDSEADQIAAICRLLAEHVTTIASSQWAGVFVRKLEQQEQILRQFTEDVAPGWYAGSCSQKIADAPDGPLLCGSGVYVVPGLTWVTCRSCGVTTYAREHLDTVRDEARAWVAQPMALAKAIVALLDTEQSVPRLHKRISKWGEREQIAVIRVTRTEHVYDLDLRTMVYREIEYGPKRFRLGDVLDMLEQSSPTRTDIELIKAEADAEAAANAAAETEAG